MKQDTLLAWHFVGAALRNGKPVPPDGAWLTVRKPLVICEHGLHYSRDPLDALRYAPGPVLCRVECRRLGEQHSDKGVCGSRRIVQRVDMTNRLREFERWCVLRALSDWPDPPAVVTEWIQTGRPDLRDAAWSVMREGPRVAAAVAWVAWETARAAGAAAPWVAATWAAAWAVDVAADAAAMRLEQRTRFNAVVNKAFGVETTP